MGEAAKVQEGRRSHQITRRNKANTKCPIRDQFLTFPFFKNKICSSRISPWRFIYYRKSRNTYLFLDHLEDEVSQLPRNTFTYIKIQVVSDSSTRICPWIQLWKLQNS